MTPFVRSRRRQPDGQWPPTARCISLTTFRRTGDPVSTPVWFVSRGSELWVWTDERSGKVARLRRDPACRVAPCTMSGTVTGAATDTQARFLREDEAG